MDPSSVIWIFFVFLFFYPQVLFRYRLLQRYKFIKQFEAVRKTRAIVMIHRQEQLALFGIPLYKYITIEDSEEILRAIRMTPEDMPIDLILHTPGGLVLASEQIAIALKEHKAKTTVIIPHYAMSGGSLIALAADEIIIDKNAVMGPVDPQIGQYPAASIINTINTKYTDELDDETLILGDIARKAIVQVKEFVYDILKDKMGEEKANYLSETLSTGKWTHDYPLTINKLKDLGIEVNTNLPNIVYELFDLYRQPVNQRPSVQYVPVPYKRGTKK
ncbi:ClpP class serine protease [Methanococcus maripaludis]|uniref:ClpP class serine protease n=1 Tax=Methanococcus maripaludis TaxID=39152 RepID=A0A7J9P3R3_METMI|nr:ATP-dependent Clp protease proteolytic subunit [Methanococcus maripaludis]MBA2854013.1 ClpP class serine protease [Methanococcus maripaludis]